MHKVLVVLAGVAMAAIVSQGDVDVEAPSPIATPTPTVHWPRQEELGEGYTIVTETAQFDGIVPPWLAPEDVYAIYLPPGDEPICELADILTATANPTDPRYWRPPTAEEMDAGPVCRAYSFLTKQGIGQPFSLSAPTPRHGTFVPDPHATLPPMENPPSSQPLLQ